MLMFSSLTNLQKKKDCLVFDYNNQKINDLFSELLMSTNSFQHKRFVVNNYKVKQVFVNQKRINQFVAKTTVNEA